MDCSTLLRKSSEKIYTFYVVGALLCSVVRLFGYVPFVSDAYFYKVFPIIGLIPLGMSFYIGHHKISKKETCFFSMVILLALVHYVYWWHYLEISHIVKQLFWFLFDFLLIFSFDRCFSRYVDYCRAFLLCLKVFILVCLILNVLSVFLQIGAIEIIDTAHGNIRMGYYYDYGRNYGITMDSLAMATSDVFSWVASLFVYREALWRKIAVCNFIFSFLFMGALVSRGVYLIIMVTIFLFFFVKAVIMKDSNKLSRTLYSFLAVLVFFCLAIVFSQKIASVLPSLGQRVIPRFEYYVDGLIISNKGNTNFTPRYFFHSGSAQHTLDIWKSNSNYENLINILIGLESTDGQHVFGAGSLSGLTLLFSYGLLMLALFAFFCFYEWHRILRVCAQNFSCLCSKNATLIILALALVIGGVWRYVLLPSGDTVAIVWWLFMGYLTRWADEKSEDYSC